MNPASDSTKLGFSFGARTNEDKKIRSTSAKSIDTENKFSFTTPRTSDNNSKQTKYSTLSYVKAKPGFRFKMPSSSGISTNTSNISTNTSGVSTKTSDISTTDKSSGSVFGATVNKYQNRFNFDQSSSAGLVPNTQKNNCENEPNGFFFGTCLIEYGPVLGIEEDPHTDEKKIIKVKYHCITYMKNYESKSLEELRLEDYKMGRGWVGTWPLKYEPVLSTEVTQDASRTQGGPAFDFFLRQPETIDVKLCCITHMKQYEQYSVEELRLVDYRAGRKKTDVQHGTIGHLFGTLGFHLCIFCQSNYNNCTFGSIQKCRTIFNKMNRNNIFEAPESNGGIFSTGDTELNSPGDFHIGNAISNINNDSNSGNTLSNKNFGISINSDADNTQSMPTGDTNTGHTESDNSGLFNNKVLNTNDDCYTGNAESNKNGLFNQNYLGNTDASNNNAGDKSNNACTTDNTEANKNGRLFNNSHASNTVSNATCNTESNKNCGLINNNNASNTETGTSNTTDKISDFNTANILNDPSDSNTLPDSRSIFKAISETKTTEIFPNLPSHLKIILQSGLTENTQKYLLQKYAIPENSYLRGPILNDAILKEISKDMKKRDRDMKEMQDRIGHAITSIDKVMTLIGEPNEQRDLYNTCSLLADLHYNITQDRVKMIVPTLKIPVSFPPEGLERAETLFGKNLLEKIDVKSVKNHNVEIDSGVFQATSDQKVAISSLEIATSGQEEATLSQEVVNSSQKAVVLSQEIPLCLETVVSSEEVANLSQETAITRQELANTDQEVTESNLVVDDSNLKIANSSSKLFNSTPEVNLSQEITSSTQKTDTLNLKVANLNQAVANTNQEVANLSSELSNSGQDLANSSPEVVNLSQEIAALNVKADTLSIKAGKMSQELANLSFNASTSNVKNCVPGQDMSKMKGKNETVSKNVTYGHDITESWCVGIIQRALELKQERLKTKSPAYNVNDTQCVAALNQETDKLSQEAAALRQESAILRQTSANLRQEAVNLGQETVALSQESANLPLKATTLKSENGVSI